MTTCSQLFEDLIEQPFYRLLDAAESDRRSNARTACFRPVAIEIEVGHEREPTVFSRDISVSGIGLLHNKPLNVDRLTLIVPTAANHHARLDTEITWNTRCGDEWYLSGGRFVGLSALQLIALQSMISAVKVTRRLKKRQPFFRPLTIIREGSHKTNRSAFSRDISSAGIGLFHTHPLQAERVTLPIPTTESDHVELRTEMRWSEQCANGCYLSGGSFIRLSIHELPDLHV